MNICMMAKKPLLVGIVLFLLGGICQAQCLSTDTSCTDAPSARNALHAGFDASLETPPQLTLEALSVPEVIRGADWEEQNAQVFIPRGTPSWGAVAKDLNLPGLNGLGVSDNWISQEDAAWSAINLCRQNGGQDCYVELTYYNACLAVAVSENDMAFWITGVTRELAAQGVMQQCSDKSKNLCALAYARCSYPSQ